MSYVVQFNFELTDRLRDDLHVQGFTLSQPPHTVFQAKKKGLTCTLYTTGKLTVQGKGTKEFVEFYLEPEILNVFTYGYKEELIDKTTRIGVDESGKGDYFGPLCIASVFSDADAIGKLIELGVKDSKKMTDKSILTMAAKIRKSFPHAIVRIGPQKYNELIERFGNLNLLLGWGHATAISNLMDQVPHCEKVIIDQFAAEHVVQNALKQKKKEILLTQRTKAEEDPVVAAASILARATFLEELDKLSQRVGKNLLKGASSAVIQLGKELVFLHGKEILHSIAKLHFKTTKMILEEA